jgi:hypothetical protein
MKPYALVLFGVTAIAACGDLGVGGGLGALGLTPVLDSIFVGDRLVARQVHYVDSNGNPGSPGPVAWGSSDTTVAQIDTVSGAITGKKRGIAIIFARARGVTGLALVAVSDTLDITLLMDTVYMMPNDTLTLPIVVRKATPPAAAVWFTAPSNPAFSVDSLKGLVTATAVTGGPFRYIVHADSLTDTGTVTVMTLNDTAAAGGRMFFSVRGTANSHVGGTAQAMNYVTNAGRLAFRLTATHFVNGLPDQVIRVSRPDSVIAPAALAIDSLSIAQDTSVATCVTPRSWGVWGFRNGSIAALSRQGGTLSVTSVSTVPGGLAISGQFTFIAQRADLYADPLGALAITGSFVAPLIRNTTRCP